MEAVTCNRDRPRGTETLPPGIIHVESDLFPRRLWGKPEEVQLLGTRIIRVSYDVHRMK